jgi:hypothetical protein
MSSGVDVRIVDALVSACERDLGDEALWVKPRAYPESLALCIIDSIYSTGAQYGQVANIVDRYRLYRAGQGGNADLDGPAELLATFDELGSARAWAEQIGNRRPTSTTPGAPLKAEAVRDGASRLVGLGIRSIEELRLTAESDAVDVVQKSWREVPGQRSGVTWAYVLMLAGIPGTKANRLVVRYVADVLEVPVPEVDPRTVSEWIREVAKRKGWNSIHTEHAIWRFQTRRPVGEPVVEPVGEPEAKLAG